MALTDDELAWVRSEIGSADPPSDADLHTIHDRVDDAALVVGEVLTTRLADLLSKPAQFTVPGEYGQDVSSNIAGLQEQLKRLGLGSGFDGSGFSLIEPCELRQR